MEAPVELVLQGLAETLVKMGLKVLLGHQGRLEHLEKEVHRDHPGQEDFRDFQELQETQVLREKTVKLVCKVREDYQEQRV